MKTEFGKTIKTFEYGNVQYTFVEMKMYGEEYIGARFTRDNGRKDFYSLRVGSLTDKSLLMSGNRELLLKYACNKLESLIIANHDGTKCTLSDYEETIWVNTPSKKNHYSFSRPYLEKILREYVKPGTTLRRKTGYVRLLTNCNYHGYAQSLLNNDFEEYTALLDEEYPHDSYSFELEFCAQYTIDTMKLRNEVEQFIRERYGNGNRVNMYGVRAVVVLDKKAGQYKS